MWFTIAFLSALVGGICGAVLQGFRAIIVGGAIPWLGMLAWLLYHEYFIPYRGGGASMWPIAQLLAGSFAALVGAVAAATVRGIKSQG